MSGEDRKRSEEWRPFCRGCDCAEQMPRDPDDPGAYPGPDPECGCLCHEDGESL